MNKKILSRVFIVLLVVLISVSTVCFAESPFTPAKLREKIITSGDDDGVGNVKNIGGKIIGIIQIIGVIVAVAMLSIIGIKYMMGSAEERAEYKKTLFPYLIGATLIFAACGLAQIIYDWVTKSIK